MTALAEALDKSFAPAMVGRFPAETHRGDASRALAEADLVVRHRYDTAVNNHHPMEPHAVVCWWEDGKAVYNKQPLNLNFAKFPDRSGEIQSPGDGGTAD